MRIEFEDAVMPPAYRHGDKDLSRTRRNSRDRKDSLESYLSRPFIGWDGEGVTLANGKHVYVLLANSEGDYIVGSDVSPLTTNQCLRFITDCAAKYPDAIHVIYGGSYDANMMLSDWTRGDIQRVYNRDYADIKGWRVGYRQGKSLYIAKLTGAGKEKGVTLYDVVSFFQCKFTKACDDYLGPDWPNRETVVREKANRSDFDISRIKEIIKYCTYELDALLLLVNELRNRLYTAGLRLKRWDGPGACASALLQRESIKSAQDKSLEASNPAVAKAARYAYAGGRFELLQFGHVEARCYEYDINSAYPAALLNVPNLARGRWVYVSKPLNVSHEFGVYHVQYRSDSFFAPSPFFRRDYNGTICYPPSVVGWYWSPEVKAGMDYASANGYECTLLEAWVFEPYDDVKPFAFIKDLYAQRLKWKEEGNGAQVAIKLSVNSLYGKLAQQVGARVGVNGEVDRIPPFHQLEWAGYVTSYTRAKVFSAIASDPENVIAFETDAIFTKRPLNVPIGTALGEWSETVFEDLTYLQSGFYFATTQNAKEVCKSRGFDPKSVSRSSCVDALRNGGSILAVQHRFVGMGIALQHISAWRNWRKWQDLEKNLTLAPTGKRVHPSCPQCNGVDSVALGVWHWTYCGIGQVMKHSSEFPIDWINPNSDMAILTELRHNGSAQWEAIGNGESAEFL